MGRIKTTAPMSCRSSIKNATGDDASLTAAHEGWEDSANHVDKQQILIDCLEVNNQLYSCDIAQNSCQRRTLTTLGLSQAIRALQSSVHFLYIMLKSILVLNWYRFWLTRSTYSYVRSWIRVAQTEIERKYAEMCWGWNTARAGTIDESSRQIPRLEILNSFLQTSIPGQG